MSLSLQNTENYRENFQCCVSEIFIKYVGLIREYLIQCIENIYIRNTTYYRYVVYKGITTITHVFLNLLLYTRNLDLTYHHCQKSFYYYVEFIGRIEDDNHSFLQLNSKDASLFVYKKTLFELNNEFRKKFVSNEDKTIETIGRLVRIYQHLVEDIIKNHDYDHTNSSALLNKVENRLSKLCQNLLNLFIDDNNKNLEFINIIDMVERNLQTMDLDIIPILETLTKKLCKKKMTINNLRGKLTNSNNITYVNDMTVQKYVNWLFVCV
tara:strand:+ start:1107 stop:1907 length:801 start_codon:yes stop_codon:yes gene_type:complete